MSDTLRVGVIGAGAVSEWHFDGWKQHPKVELVAVADISVKRRKAAAAKYKIKAYGTYQELLADKSIQAVSIALPNYLHKEVSIAALRAGKHVLLEKPMAANAREAEAILKVWRETKRVFMVGQNYRFERDTQIVRDYIRRGELGEVYHARAFWMRRCGIPRIGSWFTQKKFAAGGCCYDIGIHYLDATLFCLNCFEAVSVSGITQRKFGHRGLGNGNWGLSEIDPKKPFDVEDMAAAFIKLKGGKSVILEASWALQADNGPDHGINLYGTEAGASLFPARIHRVRDGNYETITPTYRSLPLSEERLVHFADCILNKTAPIVKPEESLKVQKILDAIYESSRTGREVRL